MIRAYRTPIVLGVIALLVLVLFGLIGSDGDSTFRISTSGDFFTVPDLVLPSRGTALVLGVVLLVLAAGAALLVRRGRRVPVWLLAVFGVLAVLGTLSWAIAGGTLPMTQLLQGSLALAVPLVFGALGGVLSERVGVVNIAIEGQLLAGAFSSAVVASLTGNLYLGLVAAAVAGALVSLVLAVFAITYIVDQVIVGVVLNVLVVGLTSFLHSAVLDSASNSPGRLPQIEIPLLAQIPLLGPLLFEQTLIIYLMFIAVAIVTFALFRTRWGLRLRAVGEHPQAADTVGINVARTRFMGVTLGGALAGLGGAFFTLGSVGAFSQEMTAGQGYIALAALIFGRWNPVLATLAALLFGFARNLASVLGIVGSPVPSQFLLMLPYVVTLIAVAGLAGKVRGPAAAGTPYIKG
ncbi:ABC transporter permease [Arenivirga flava]|uniref:ABC transporter permease n=1 Tax=Arenivirga flava TaxID=1930060 RepID=A0AA37UHQ5_9MICO|nr:ABC transporter permease [Arenivirga flava]GMA28091.1 ABC transporter permease [Arenivirga flava]